MSSIDEYERNDGLLTHTYAATRLKDGISGLIGHVMLTSFSIASSLRMCDVTSEGHVYQFEKQTNPMELVLLMKSSG